MMVATESKEGRELKIVQFEVLPTRDVGDIDWSIGIWIDRTGVHKTCAKCVYTDKICINIHTFYA